MRFTNNTITTRWIIGEQNLIIIDTYVYDTEYVKYQAILRLYTSLFLMLVLKLKLMLVDFVILTWPWLNHHQFGHRWPTIFDLANFDLAVDLTTSTPTAPWLLWIWMRQDLSPGSSQTWQPSWKHSWHPNIIEKPATSPWPPASSTWEGGSRWI